MVNAIFFRKGEYFIWKSSMTAYKKERQRKKGSKIGGLK